MLKHPGITTASSLALVGVGIVVSLWLLTFSGHPWSSDSARWAEFGSYLSGTLGPILAFASFVGLLVSIQHQQTIQAELESRADSEVYRANATQNLGRAFETFMDGGDSNTPVSDRLAWLTVARLLISAQAISSKIDVDSIRDMYEADEEHWRRRFYEILDPTNLGSPLNNPDYFREGEQTIRGYVIDERSIRVIYKFSEWPEGREDPIEGIERFSDEDLNEMGLGRRGVSEYVQSQRRAP